MKRFSSVLFLKTFLILLLVISIIVYFYFEQSVGLRIAVVALGLVGVWQISNQSELIILLTLFLSLYDLYNIHYGLGAPIALIMIAVLLIAFWLFYLESILSKFHELLDRNVFIIYSTVMGLAILELFLAMGFWPVDPRTKSIVIMIFFYMFFHIIYLFANNVLSLKRAFGYVLVSLLILGFIILMSMRLSF